MQVTCYIARYKKQDLKTKKGRRGKKISKLPKHNLAKTKLFSSTVRDHRHESTFILIDTDMVHRITAESSQPESTIGQRNLTSRAGILSCLKPRQNQNIIHSQINHCHSQSCLLRKEVNELARGLTSKGSLQRRHT